MTNTGNYALRLQPSMMEELKKVVSEEGTTINQFINVAVAEKLAALRTAEYFRTRVANADMKAFWEILERAGTEEPRAGDELPQIKSLLPATRTKRQARRTKLATRKTVSRNPNKGHSVESPGV